LKFKFLKFKEQRTKSKEQRAKFRFGIKKAAIAAFLMFRKNISEIIPAGDSNFAF
jgi:hypothetical protein